MSPRRGGLKDTVDPGSFFNEGGNHSGYMWPGCVRHGVTTRLMVVDTLYYTPWFVEHTLIIERIGIDVSTAAAASKLVRIGIYSAGLHDRWITGELILDAGTVVVDSTGSKSITSLSTVLKPGKYWAVVVSDGAPTLRAMQGGPPQFEGFGRGNNGIGGSSSLRFLSDPFTFGALPDPGGDIASDAGGGGGPHDHMGIFVRTPL